MKPQKFMMAGLVIGGLVFLGYRKVFGAKRNEKEDCIEREKKDEKVTNGTPVELGKTGSGETPEERIAEEIKCNLETGHEITVRFAKLASAIIAGKCDIENTEILNAEDFLKVFISKAVIVYMYNEEALEKLPRDVPEMFNFLGTVNLKERYDKMIDRNRQAKGFGPKKQKGGGKKRTTLNDIRLRPRTESKQ